MTKHTKKIEAVVAETAAPTEAEITQAVAETHPQALAPKSIVKVGYKRAYAAKAIAAGRTTKAAKRCNNDWLARELEAECIEGDKFSLERFCAIFHANTGDDALVRWPSRTNGWEGRVRMSGSLVLRGIVKKAGVLRTPETTIEVPESFRL